MRYRLGQAVEVAASISAQPVTTDAQRVHSRDPAIEGLRIISALGIVWFHASVPGSVIGYAGLTVFILLSVYFEIGPNHERPADAMRLAKRLLIPWAFWWSAYAALNLVLGTPAIDTSRGVLAGVLAGPSIHLWYLPFIFVVLLFVGGIKRAVRPGVLCILASVAAVALILGVGVWRGPSLSAGYPVAQWVHALAPVMVGAVFGLLPSSRLRSACLIAVLAAAGVASFLEYGSVAQIYLLGALLTLAAIYLPSRVKASIPDVGWLSGAMLGVYLLHPFVLRVVRPVTEIQPIGGVVLAFACSTVIILTAQRTAPRIVSWVV